MSKALPPAVQAVIGGASGRTPKRTKSVIPPESEAHFQAFVIRLAKLHGWLVYHTTDSLRSQPGFPDLFMLRGKRAIAAELKRERGVLSKAQDSWLTAMTDAGIETFLWRPADKQGIAEIFR